MTTARCGSLVVLVVVLVSGPDTITRGDTVELAYSFHDQDSGGAAIAQVDPASGKILRSKPLFDLADCQQPLKVRRTTDGQYLAMSNLDEDGPQLYLWSAAAPDDPRGIGLPSLPDEVRIAGRLVLVTLEEDAVVAVDLDQQR